MMHAPRAPMSLLVALLAAPAAALADDVPAEGVVASPTPATDDAAHPPDHEVGKEDANTPGSEETPIPEGGRKVNIDFHGFVETIARYDSGPNTFDFSIQQAEIDMIGDWNDVVFFRSDLQYDAYYFDASSPVGFLGSFVEQAVVDVQFYKPAALKLGVGRFNAPMGFEALDPLDRPIGSYSQVFNYMDPFLLTGARLSGAYDLFDFVLWVSQGYEVIVDNNTDKTFGGRLGFRPSSAFYLGVAGAYGSEYAENANRRGTLAVDYLITPVDGLLIGGEVNFRHEADASRVDAGEDGMALGLLLEGAYRFHDYFGLAARFDTIQDFDGILFGTQVGTYTWSVAPTVHLFDHARVQLEYKGAAADEDLFLSEAADPEARTTSPTASQLYQSLPLFNGVGVPTSMNHALTLQMIGNF